MRSSRLVSLLCCVAALSALIATAHAEGDDFYLGDGTTSATIGDTEVVNSYAQVTAAISAGDSRITVSTTTGFAAGNLVLILETTGLGAQTSGVQTGVDLSASKVGSWELARLSAVGNGTLTANAPLILAHDAEVTQVVRVAEYNNLMVTGTINAQPWNGATGGVVAILAQGTITLSATGLINASGMGFRGGVLVNSDADHLGCTELDLPATPQFPVSAWAQKGEGIVPSEYGANFVARGNVANGAGGGDCDNSGGGGGGNGGVGGMGGETYSGDGTRAVGGLGGAPLIYSQIDHDTFGGGGGSGQANNNQGSGGSAGGGLVFIRAGTVTALGGAINASGAAGPNSDQDGAGGGGGGGTIYLRVAGSVTCVSSSSFTVTGGAGGNVTNAVAHGPGGGGGGGRMLFQGTMVGTCPITTDSGAAGTTVPDGNHGATPAAAVANGILTILAGTFAQPATPTLTTPADGSTGSNPSPAFTGTATANTEVVIYVDGLPIGTTTADGNGNFTFTPTTPLPVGMHTGQVATEVLGEQSPKSTGNGFAIQSIALTAPVVIVPANDSLTDDNTPTVSGTGPANDMIKVFIDSILVGTVTAGGDGTWSYTLTAGQALGDGIHLANAQATANGGTSALSNTNQFTVDATAPAAPVVLSPADGSTVMTPNPAVSGTAEPVSTVKVFIDANLVGTVVANNIGNWIYELTARQSLANGLHTASAQAIDEAGNVSPLSMVNAFNVASTSLPTPTVITPPNQTSINDPTPLISGTAQAGDTITIFVDGSTFATVTADQNGDWSYQPTMMQALSDGVHMVNVMAANGSGGISGRSNTNSFTVDTMPPDTTILSGPPLTNAPPNAEFISTSNEMLVTYECSVDGGAFVVCSDPAMIGPLGAGMHTFEVRAVDRAGNVDPTPATYTWTIAGDLDASVPDVRVIPDAVPTPDARPLPDALIADVSLVPDSSVVDVIIVPPADARMTDARAAADTGGTHDGAGNGDGGGNRDGGGTGDGGANKDAGPAADANGDAGNASSAYSFLGGGCTCSLAVHDASGTERGHGVALGGLFALGMAGVFLKRKRR